MKTIVRADMTLIIRRLLYTANETDDLLQGCQQEATRFF